jgi:hypothetical protein
MTEELLRTTVPLEHHQSLQERLPIALELE